MLHGINRSNRLFMAGNFLFALSYGLWMNLRQLHLGDLGASPAEVGTALGITESLAYGAIALASWLAGQLYERTPTHDLPLVVGLAALLVLAGLWAILRAGRRPRALDTETPVPGTH